MSDSTILFVRLGPPVEDDDRELPRRRYGHDDTFSEQELQDSARAWWVVDIARASQCGDLAAVRNGEVLGVWTIVPGSWRSIDGRRFGKSPIRWGCDVNGHVKVPAGGHEKSPPQGMSQALVDGPPALVLASFIR
jgi:hypothetical protein